MVGFLEEAMPLWELLESLVGFPMSSLKLPLDKSSLQRAEDLWESFPSSVEPEDFLRMLPASGPTILESYCDLPVETNIEGPDTFKSWVLPNLLRLKSVISGSSAVR